MTQVNVLGGILIMGRPITEPSVATLVMTAIPDDLFVMALNECSTTGTPLFEYGRKLNEMFVSNGVPFQYRMNEVKIVPAGDALIAELVVEPALDALATSPSFHRSRDLLIKAYRALRETATADAAADAVDDARRAIEYGLLALIDSAGLDRPTKNDGRPNHTPDPLFTVLQANGVLPKEAKEMVLGAAFLRGRTEAGHAGLPEIQHDVAEAVLASAAASLLYLVRGAKQIVASSPPTSS